MEALNRAYNGLRSFVDQFANSTTELDGTAPQKIENREAWYAEWDDNYMGDLLDNSLTKSLLRKVADAYLGERLDDFFAESTKITADTYPHLYEVYAACCDHLGMHTPPKVYVDDMMVGINALSLEVKENQFILISPRATVCLSQTEQAFLLGHELGHHQQGNLVCHTVNGLMETINDSSEIFGPLLLDTIEVPLKRWCRRSEFNADRAGYICCDDIDAVKHLFLQLGMDPNPTAYMDYLELEDAHPALHTRWNALMDYIEKKHR